MADYCFIKPLDVLYLRGNRLFDGAGAHGTALMPPWPSLAAGAIRSRMLADHQIDPTIFKEAKPEGAIGKCLGTPQNPGDFRITNFFVAERTDASMAIFFPLPADLVAKSDGHLAYLQPTPLHPALQTSYPLPFCPLLAADAPSKPLGGQWLNQAGLGAYLDGVPLNLSTHCIQQKKLWALDARLGIALDSERRSAAEGQIYTSEAVAMAQDRGFLVGIDGAAGLLPEGGLVRLGGDGRGAEIFPCAFALPDPDWRRIAEEKRFRLLLTTPGLFADGWKIPGLSLDDGRWLWRGGAFSACMKAACVTRGEVVSGWDVAHHRPKEALRVAPTGSVYFFDEFSGDIEALQALSKHGLWPLVEDADQSRKSEGFNNILIAAWPRHD